jgi:hypothetical protein
VSPLNSFLRQGLSMELKLTLNSYLCLLNGEITGVCHHTWLSSLKLKIASSYRKRRWISLWCTGNCLTMDSPRKTPALICSTCQFLLCKYSHYGWNQADMNHWRWSWGEMHVTSSQGIVWVDYSPTQDVTKSLWDSRINSLEEFYQLHMEFGIF